jgi:hypothetical protein
MFDGALEAGLHFAQKFCLFSLSSTLIPRMLLEARVGWPRGLSRSPLWRVTSTFVNCRWARCR